MSASAENTRTAPDQLLIDIARYVDEYEARRPEAYEAARYALMDALGCAAQGLDALR